VRFGEGVSPFPIGVAPGEVAVPLSRKFLTFWLKIVYFGVYSTELKCVSTLSHTFIYICNCWRVMPDPLGYFKEH